MILNEEELKEIEERANAASEGPWDWDEVDGSIEARSGGYVAIMQPHGNVRTVMRTGEEFSHKDARFISSARTDIPRLLESHRELAEEYAETCKGYRQLDKNWAVVHDIAMSAIRSALNMPDASVPEMVAKIKELQAK